MLTHDRPIHVPCDDSVVRVLPDGELPIRRARGYAPLPVQFGQALPTVLAVGGEVKNSCCLTDGGSAFCSAHIGDMGNLATLRAFDRVVAQLTTVHRVTPEVIAADLHPAYRTGDWAQRRAGGSGEPALHLVQHHHAHVVSLLAEHGRLGEQVIGVAFDGTGYGADGAIWGGEILLVGADPTRFERVGHLLPVPLAGGDAAVRNPCRTALGYLAAAGVGWDPVLPPVAACTDAERATLAAGYAGYLNPAGHPPDEGYPDPGRGGTRTTRMAAWAGSSTWSPRCSGSGTASATRRRPRSSSRSSRRRPVRSRPNWRCRSARTVSDLDHRPLIRALAAEVAAGIPAAVLARAFHVAVAAAVSDAANLVARRTGVRSVGLTGGVFQNVLLTGIRPNPPGGARPRGADPSPGPAERRRARARPGRDSRAGGLATEPQEAPNESGR